MDKSVFLARLFALALLVLLPALGLSLGLSQSLSQAQVEQGAARLYRERIEALRGAHSLDPDPAFHARVGRVLQPLLAQAARDYPFSAAWSWEWHTTIDGDDNAFAMAGGKLLVSRDFVRRLELDDAELAMLLSHEIAHAVLLHNLREFEEALRLDPQWVARPFAELEHAVDHDGALMRRLAPLNLRQEEEADREGMALAWRAGWPAARLARYFHKLSRNSHSAYQDSFAHPAPARRWQAARALAARLEAQADAQPGGQASAQAGAQPKGE